MIIVAIHLALVELREHHRRLSLDPTTLRFELAGTLQQLVVAQSPNALHHLGEHAPIMTMGCHTVSRPGNRPPQRDGGRCQTVSRSRRANPIDSYIR